MSGDAERLKYQSPDGDRITLLATPTAVELHLLDDDTGHRAAIRVPHTDLPIITGWLTGALAAAHAAALAPGTRVRATAGRHNGRTGTVQDPDDILDPEYRAVRFDGDTRDVYVRPARLTPAPTTYRAGDPDPTPNGGDWCCADDPHDDGAWTCTWPTGHTGDHVAGDGDVVCATWPQAPTVLPPTSPPHLAHEWQALTPAEREDVHRWALAAQPPPAGTGCTCRGTREAPGCTHDQAPAGDDEDTR